MFDLNDNALDTLDFSSGEVSEPRNGKSVFKTFNINGLALNLYQYDLNQEIAIDSMPSSENFGLPSLGTPQWINDNEVLVHNLRTIAIADFTTQSYQVVKAFPEECYNYKISSVRPVPNRPNEILYVLNHYFYNEDGEYRKRHDLVHLNIETGEERVLVIE